MSTLPFLEALHEQRLKKQKFAIATVVQVHGSASARTGSKAIFDFDGKNIFGWVGGGCAERFVGEQSIEAIQKRQTRIVTADLDDEIFGLGIACGGKMDVFIEPVFPDEFIALPRLGPFSEKIELMCRSFGWPLVWTSQTPLKPTSFAEALGFYLEALAKTRQRELRSLRDLKDLPVQFVNKGPISSERLLILGQSRITEALAVLAQELGWQVELKAHFIDRSLYPRSVRCDCLEGSFRDLQFEKEQMVIVASHHSEDPQTVLRAVNAGCPYVGMIGSRKRAIEVLNLFDTKITAPLYVPAGLDIDARGPEEIALSIVGEILNGS